MPEYQETIPMPGRSANELQELSYGTLVSLNWNPLYAAEAGLIATTEKKWNKAAQQMTINVEDGFMYVKSTMINNESFDIGKKNKKNVQQFLQSFHSLSSDDIARNQWRDSIEALKARTLELAAEETKEAEEVQKIMGGGTPLYVTYAIIAINVLVFIWMVMKGVSFMSPTTIQLLNWGGNHLDLTTTGDWWRLLTSMFLHGGIVHLLFNMYALYMSCIYLEPMLGPKRLAFAYLCAGIFGSLASLAFHSSPVVSVGASGAIFGLYGLFLALLTTQLIPKKMRQQLLQSIGVFVAFNLFYGLKSGIDNAAHVGGLVSGFLMGFAYYPGLKKKVVGENESGKTAIIISAIVVITVAVSYAVLQALSSKADPAMKVQMNLLGSNDGEKYMKEMQAFSDLEEKALAPFRDQSVSYNPELVERLNTVSLPAWKQAAAIIDNMKTYSIPSSSKEIVKLFDVYVKQRQQQIAAISDYVTFSSTENSNKVDKIGEQIEATIKKISDIKQ